MKTRMKFGIVLFSLTLCIPQKLLAGEKELLEAARKGNITILEKELSSGISIEAKTAEGYSPLALAVYYNQIDAARVLFKRGALIETRQKDGYTPLILSARKGFGSMAEELLSWGADPFALDAFGHDAWFHAYLLNKLELIDIMRSAQKAPETPSPGANYQVSSAGYAEGLHIQVFWFERAVNAKTGLPIAPIGTLSSHSFPVGIEYPSQIIQAIYPLTPAHSIIAGSEKGSTELQLNTKQEVKDFRPLLIGFAAELGVYDYLTWRFVGNDFPITKNLPEAVQSFTQESARYDFSDPKIQAVIKSILSESKGSHDTIFRINDFIYKSIKYAAVAHPNTASQILGWGKGRCGEFTRLAITLLRGCGIPARAVWGLGEYPWLSDADHAWVEAWLPDAGWVPIQPQMKPKPSVYPVSFHRFYMMTRYSDETGNQDWGRPSAEQGKGLTKHATPNGVGVFIPMARSKMLVYRELVTSIIADEPANRDKFEKRIEEFSSDQRIFLWWLLVSSSDEALGLRAAKKLIEIARIDPHPKVELIIGTTLEAAGVKKLDQMMKESPVFVQNRIKKSLE